MLACGKFHWIRLEIVAVVAETEERAGLRAGKLLPVHRHLRLGRGNRTSRKADLHRLLEDDLRSAVREEPHATTVGTVERKRPLLHHRTVDPDATSGKRKRNGGLVASKDHHALIVAQVEYRQRPILVAPHHDVTRDVAPFVCERTPYAFRRDKIGGSFRRFKARAVVGDDRLVVEIEHQVLGARFVFFDEVHRELTRLELAQELDQRPLVLHTRHGPASRRALAIAYRQIVLERLSRELGRLARGVVERGLVEKPGLDRRVKHRVMRLRDESARGLVVKSEDVGVDLVHRGKPDHLEHLVEREVARTEREELGGSAVSATFDRVLARDKSEPFRAF